MGSNWNRIWSLLTLFYADDKVVIQTLEVNLLRFVFRLNKIMKNIIWNIATVEIIKVMEFME